MRPEEVADDSARNLAERIGRLKKRVEALELLLIEVVFLLQLRPDHHPCVPMQVQDERRAGGQRKHHPATASRRRRVESGIRRLQCFGLHNDSPSRVEGLWRLCRGMKTRPGAHCTLLFVHCCLYIAVCALLSVHCWPRTLLSVTSLRLFHSPDMKIASVRTCVVGDVRPFLFVIVETDRGIQGLGEAGVTWREQAVAGYIEALIPSLIGQDPRRIEHLWQVMLRCGFFPGGRIGAAAISAVDIALWDIKAKSLGVPVYELLGGLVRERVACYPHVADNNLEAMVDQCRELVAQGWRYVRFNLPSRDELLEPRQSVRDGVALVKGVREAVGPEIGIIIDAHTRLDPVDAVSLCRQLEPLDPFFVEDPVRCENAAAIGRLRRHTAAPIAMGEQYATKWEFREPIENDWIDYCRLDLCIAGGLTEARKIAAWCETHYIAMAPHNPLGPISTAACLHLDLATSNFAVQECARVPGDVLEDLFPTQVPFQDGWMLPPTAPGLGVEFNEAAVSRYPANRGDCPRLRRADGAFTNW